MTPLGRPVVPDVYMSRWMSSGSAGTVAAARGRLEFGELLQPLRRVRRDTGRTSAASMPDRRRAGQLLQRLVADQCPSLRVLEDVAHLRRRQPPVDRHGHGAEVVGGEHHLEELRAIVGEQPDDVSLAHTTFGEPPARAIARASISRVRRDPALEHRHRPVRAPARRDARARRTSSHRIAYRSLSLHPLRARRVVPQAAAGRSSSALASFPLASHS